MIIAKSNSIFLLLIIVILLKPTVNGPYDYWLKLKLPKVL